MDGTTWGCGISFARPDALKSHWKHKLGQKCRARFDEESRVQTKSTPTQEPVLEIDRMECRLCFRTCYGSLNIIKHFESHIQDCDSRPFMCDCGLRFAFAEMYRLHSCPFPGAPIICGPGPVPQSGAPRKWKRWGCKQKFDLPHMLNRHLADRRGKDGKLLPNVCKASLRNAEDEIKEKIQQQIAKLDPSKNSGNVNQPHQQSREVERLSTMLGAMGEKNEKLLEREEYEELMRDVVDTYKRTYGVLPMVTDIGMASWNVDMRRRETPA